jgi:hypothetical protein
MQSELRPALDAYWYRMSEGALNSLNWVLPTTPTSVRSCTGTESSGGSSGGSQRRGNNEVPAQNGSASESRPKGTERDRGKARGGGDEEGNERKKRAPANRVLRSGGRYFACPFFQRDPEKYSQCRSCPGPGWKTVHRLK